MSDLHADATAPSDVMTAPDDLGSASAETERIIRSGTFWVGAVLVAAAAGLGPLLGSGWRPSLLSDGGQLAWWAGLFLGVLGLAGLVWAGCPTLGFTVDEAWKQKRMSVRAGILLSVIGLVIAGVAVMLGPVG